MQCNLLLRNGVKIMKSKKVKNTIEMRVIEEPKKGSRAILQSGNPSTDFVFIVGEGDTDYICGNCGNIICKNISKDMIVNVVFLCPKCKSYNEI